MNMKVFEAMSWYMTVYESVWTYMIQDDCI